MALTEREQRLKFLGLTEHDVQLLRALKPLIEEHSAAVEDAFYQHLLDFPETAQLLRDRTTVERLKKLQRDYLLRITDGTFDETYFEDRRRLGRTHERVGLEPRWYLLAYNHYFKLITPLIRQHYGGDPVRAQDSIIALEKVFMLDASLAMDAYIASDRFRHAQQLERIVQDSADVIFMLDNEHCFRTWNHAAERVFGWRAEEILGKPFTTIVPQEMQAAGELERIEKEILQHDHFAFDTVRLAKDGQRVPVEVTVSVLRDPHGQPVGRSAILRDVTERRRLEGAKLQAERLAVIGAMSAKLAHEIRNPLSSVRLNIDLTRDEIDLLSKDHPETGNEARSLLQSIDSEVRRIHHVVEDYLKFARLPKMSRGRVALNEMLAQELSFMQPLFDASAVTLRTELDAALPLIQGDEDQLWQAVLNLIRNAMEAMPAGGTITVRTSCTDTHVRLVISDTGKGINPQHQPSIFKPFFSTKTGGTGLGLPLAQQIIMEHEGRIECESIESVSTTFIIHLPRTLTTEHGTTSSNLSGR